MSMIEPVLRWSERVVCASISNGHCKATQHSYVCKGVVKDEVASRLRVSVDISMCKDISAMMDELQRCAGAGQLSLHKLL